MFHCETGNGEILKDNVVDFKPIDMEVNGLEIIADVSDFLVNNKSEIIEKIKPTVLAFLANEHMFDGLFSVAFTSAFEEFVSSLIRDEVASHFTQLNPEQILMMTNKEVISMIATDDFFKKDSYR